jgi:hypothetical protein
MNYTQAKKDLAHRGYQVIRGDKLTAGQIGFPACELEADRYYLIRPGETQAKGCAHRKERNAWNGAALHAGILANNA